MNFTKMMENLTSNHWIAFFVLVAVIYLLIKLFNAQQMTIEGLTSKNQETPFEQMTDNLAKTNKDASDAFMKQKTDIENFIIQQDEFLTIQNLAMFTDSKGITPENTQLIIQNEQLKKALNTCMEYLDGKSGTSSAVSKASSYF